MYWFKSGIHSQMSNQQKPSIGSDNGLTHWDRVTHICVCVGNLTIIVSDNGLSPARRQAIIGNNAGLLLIELLGTNFSEISIEIPTFSFKKMHLNMSSAKWRPSCLGLNVLGACRRHGIIWTNDGLDYWSIDMSPGLNLNTENTSQHWKHILTLKHILLWV